jgi:hypothetical protein
MVKDEQGIVLTNKDIVDKVNDYYHNGTILIFSDFGNSKINIANTNNLLAEESDTRITLRDDSDLEIVIFKSSISRSSLSIFELDDKEIIIELGNSNISLLLCNC